MGSTEDAGCGGTDVLRRLRAETAAEHRDVERTLDLLDPVLERGRLAAVLDRMHGFWAAAEEGLDAWAARHPDDAADLVALGRAPTGAGPRLPAPRGTDEALGRLYVLEGSTLGGAVIDRHLTALAHLGDVRVRAFSPYGGETGAMWAAFRRVTRERVSAGGNPDDMVDAARETFRALADWCRPAAAAVPA